VITPSISILAEPPVSVVDRIAAKHGTPKLPKPICNSCILPRARRSARAITTVRVSPRWPPNTPPAFPKVNLFTIDDTFGGWQKAQKRHFDDGGVFDKIYTPGS
jgi:sulfate/thiosulfate transport system substrate-binding protein